MAYLEDFKRNFTYKVVDIKLEFCFLCENDKNFLDDYVLALNKR